MTVSHSSAASDGEPDSRLPLQYEDGPDYCTVKDAQGRDFALTMQPELMQAMERALREDISRLSRPPVREALELAEDVLSRAPFSTGFWPNGMHPQTGISKIRDAIRSLDEPQLACTCSCYAEGHDASCPLSGPWQNCPSTHCRPIPESLHLIDDAGGGP